MKATDLAINSQGSALKENEVFMNSLQGVMNQLTSSFSRFASESIDSGFIKSILRATTSVIDFSTEIGGLPTIITAVGASFVLLNLNSVVGGFKALSSGVAVFTQTLIGTKSMTDAYTASTQIATVSTTALKVAMGGILALGIGVAIWGIKSALDANNKSIETLSNNLNTNKTKIQEIQTEINKLKGIDTPSNGQQQRIDKLKEELVIRQNLVKEQEKQLAKDEVKETTKDVEKLSGKDFSLVAEIQELEAKRDAIKDVVAEQEKYNSLNKKIADKESERTVIASELMNAMDSLSKNMNYLTESERKNAQQTLTKIEYMRDAIMVSTGLASATKEVEEANKKLSQSYQSNTQELEALRANTELLSESTDNSIKEIDSLNSAIEKVSRGQNLNSKELINLINLYPSLRNQISQTNGVHTITIDVLKNLKGEKVAEAKTAIEAELKKAIATRDNTMARLKAYNSELAGIKVLSRAQAVLASTSIASAQSFAMTGQVSAETVNSVVKDAQSISELNDIIQGLEVKLTSVGIASTNFGEATKKAGSSASKAKKEIKDYAKEVWELGKALTKVKTDAVDLKKQFDLVAQGAVNSAFKEQTLNIDQLNVKYKEACKNLDILTKQYFELRKNTKGDEAKKKLDAINEKMKEQASIISDCTNGLKAYNEEIKNNALKVLQDEQAGLNDIINKTIALIKHEKNLEKEKYQEHIKDAKEAYDKDLEYLKERVERHKEAINEELDRLKESTSERKKIIKSEADAEKKRLQDELKRYQDIINKRKELLDSQEAERSYQEQLAEEQQKLAELQQQLREAENVDTAEGRSKKLQLKKDVAEQEKKIADFQREWDIKGQKEALDEQLKNQEDKIQSEIDAIDKNADKETDILDKRLEDEQKKLKDQLKYWEKYLATETKELKDNLDKQVANYQSYITEIDKYLQQEGTIRLDAMNRIDKEGKKLYDKLLEYNRVYGDGVDSTITKSWDNAQSALEKYQDTQMSVLETLERMQKLESNLSSGKGSSHVSGGGSSSKVEDKETWQDEAIRKMQKNSRAWANAKGDKKRQNELAKENEKLGNKLGAYIDGNGVWWTDSSKRKKLYDTIGTYHTGGIAGGKGEAKLKSTEMFAKLLKGEPVVTESQANSFMTKTLPTLLGASGQTVNNSRGGDVYNLVINTDGNVDDSTYGRLKQYVDTTFSKLNNTNAMWKKGNRRSAKSLSI